MRHLLPVLIAVAFAATAQTYNGPRPEKADLPYLKHADQLIPTEAAEAKEEKGKKEAITYAVAGATSAAKTPLASPIFLLQSDKLAASSLQLFKLDSRNGRREVVATPKKPLNPIRVEVTRLSRDGLFRIEVQESLDRGEYSLTPEGSNQVFCFQVY